MRLVPVTFAEACAFVAKLHRHNKPPVGHKFSVGVQSEDGITLLGVAMCGRPVARALQDGFTLEINRTCTDGSPNANSMLYGACRAAAKALGYHRLVTYTQADESGTSLRAAGFRRAADLKARDSWAGDSVMLKSKRDPIGNGGVPRVRWEWP